MRCPMTSWPVGCINTISPQIERSCDVTEFVHPTGNPTPVRPFRQPKRQAFPGTVDTSWEERLRDKGMALTFIPPDLLERAAHEEHWTDSDRQHCSRMLRQAFEESFQVKEIQRSVNGLIAYDSPFVSLEPVRFQEGAEKPVLQALEDLSKKLLLAKPD